jgi:hypothetical protein
VTRRTYFGPPPPGAPASTPRAAARFDPRFVVFKFVHNLLLRPKQVQIVTQFLAELTRRRTPRWCSRTSASTPRRRCTSSRSSTA